MTTEERLEEIAYMKDRYMTRLERECLEEYRKAVAENNEKILALYDEFDGGRDFRSIGRILDNASTWRRAQMFGFTRREYDEYGHIITEAIAREEIPIYPAERKNFIGRNSINLAEFPDHSWTAAYDWAFPQSGRCSLASIWDDRMATRADAVRDGIRRYKEPCQEVLDSDSTGPKAKALARALIAAADKVLEENTAGPAIQLEFDFTF